METRKERGFTLLEVLVSILIFSIGVLGMVAMQARALQNASDAQDRNRASALANELAGNMWAYRSGDTVGNAYLAPYYTNIWLPKVAATLPGGTGAASAPDPTTGLVTITINWTGTTRGVTGIPEQYLTEVIIQ